MLAQGVGSLPPTRTPRLNPWFSASAWPSLDGWGHLESEPANGSIICVGSLALAHSVCLSNTFFFFFNLRERGNSSSLARHCLLSSSYPKLLFIAPHLHSSYQASSYSWNSGEAKNTWHSLYKDHTNHRHLSFYSSYQVSQYVYFIIKCHAALNFTLVKARYSC